MALRLKSFPTKLILAFIVWHLTSVQFCNSCELFMNVLLWRPQHFPDSIGSLNVWASLGLGGQASSLKLLNETSLKNKNENKDNNKENDNITRPFKPV